MPDEAPVITTVFPSSRFAIAVAMLRMVVLLGGCRKGVRGREVLENGEGRTTELRARRVSRKRIREYFCLLWSFTLWKND